MNFISVCKNVIASNNKRNKPRYTVYHCSLKNNTMLKVVECQTRRETYPHRIYDKSDPRALSGFKSIVYDINGNFLSTP